jgi:hypothetical protein
LATSSASPPRGKSDYLKYYHERCSKLAPRSLDWPHYAYEDTLALLMLDYPNKSESQCVIALANMELYAPFVGPRV